MVREKKISEDWNEWFFNKENRVKNKKINRKVFLVTGSSGNVIPNIDF